MERQTRWGDRPYYSLNEHLKQRFGEKIYKLALDGGLTCPNRDGAVYKRQTEEGVIHWMNYSLFSRSSRYRLLLYRM